MIGRDSGRNRSDFDIRLQVDPQRNLTAVERRLLHDGSRTGRIGLFPGPQHGDLIGRIAQKIAFENGTQLAAVTRQQVKISGGNIPELLGERGLRIGHVQHRMAFADTAAAFEISDLNAHIAIKQYFA